MVLHDNERSFGNCGWRQKIYNFLMMANYERLVQLLGKMEHSEYTKIVEKELSKFSQEPLSVNLLIMALADQKLSHNTKLAAAVVLNRTISENYLEIEQPTLIEQIVNLFFDFSVEFKYKQTAQKSLVDLLELAEPTTVHEVFKLMARVSEGIEEISLPQNENSMIQHRTLSEVSFQKVEMIFYIYKSVLDANNHMYRLFDEISSTLPHFLSLIHVTPHPNNIRTLYRMADFYAAFMERTIQSNLEGVQDFADWFCNSDLILSWIYQIYSLKGVDGQSWVSLAPQPHPDEINDLKTRTAELHNNLLLSMLSSASHEFEVRAAIISRNCNASRILKNTLTVYGGCYGQLAAFESFVTVLMKCLIALYQLSKAFFTNTNMFLLHDVVFPILRIKEEEMRLFEEDPQEFSRLAEDCCDHQKYGILKTDAAMLLEVIIDENDEAALYVLQHCIISLKVRLGLDQNFSRQAPNFLSIETAFLILSIQSYRIGKCETELVELRNILNFNHVRNKLSNLQLSRLFAFLAYNYNQIYLNPLDGEEWISLALATDQHPSVEIAALDFITNVVEDYFNIQFFKQFGIRTLLKGSLHINALLKIITFHMGKISEIDMIAMVDILFQLINRQITAYQRREKAHTIDLGNCLQLIRKLMEKDYCRNKPALKAKIWEVINFMPDLQRVNLDDELMRIVTLFANKQETLTQHILATIQPVIILYKLDRQESTPYLAYFNAIIMKGHSSIAAHIITILLESIYKIKGDSMGEARNLRGKSIAKITIVLQNILAVHGKDLPQLFIDQIGIMALQFIPDSDNPQEKLDSILVARMLNLFFLCHMIKKNDLALRKILLFQDSPIFQSYDLRVLCLCLSKEILNEKDVVAVTEMINIMVKAISANKAQPVVIKPRKNPLSIKPSSTKIRIKRVEDYEKILKFITTPFPQEAEPEQKLQSVIETMKQNNPNLCHAILKSLTKTVYEKLKVIMSEVTIQGKKRHIIHVGNLKENGKIATTDVISKMRDKKRGLAQSEEEDDFPEEMENDKRKTQKKRRKDDSDEDL